MRHFRVSSPAVTTTHTISIDDGEPEEDEMKIKGRAADMWAGTIGLIDGAEGMYKVDEIKVDEEGLPYLAFVRIQRAKSFLLEQINLLEKVCPDYDQELLSHLKTTAGRIQIALDKIALAHPEIEIPPVDPFDGY